MRLNKSDYGKIIGFEWDEGNSDKNWTKHNVHYKEAEEVFINERVYFRDEKHSQKEQRYIVYGITNSRRKLSVIFTMRKDRIRIISARDQSKKEKQTYEKNT